MKTKFRKISVIFLITFSVLTLYNCQKDNVNTNSNDLYPIESFKTLDEPTLLGDEIFLPKGTQWQFTNKSHSEVAFKLPKDFAFLLHNELTNEVRIAPSGGGYSCTCSAGGSCITFWNKQVGYGCLQGTCTGTCKGRRTRKQSNFVIEGVLYIKNDMVDPKKPKFMASLSQKGKDLIFKSNEFRNEIKRTYDFVYKYTQKPNFSDDNLLSKVSDKDYTLIKTYLFGFELALLIPNDKNLDVLMPEVQKIAPSRAPSRCDCSNNNDTKSSCDLNSKGMFGYKVYYCTGFTTCTMQ